MISRRIVYPVVAGLLFGLWLFYTLLMGFGGYMMSVDEEWEGWGDGFLNPYIRGSWTLLGGVSALRRRCRRRLAGDLGCARVMGCRRSRPALSGRMGACRYGGGRAPRAAERCPAPAQSSSQGFPAVARASDGSYLSLLWG